MRETIRIFRPDNAIRTEAKSNFDILYNYSFNIGGKPHETALDIENIIETNKLQKLSLFDITIARTKDDQPCIIHEEKNQFACGIWFPLDWYFTILMKSEKLAESYLRLLFSVEYRDILYVLEKESREYLDMHYEAVRDNYPELTKKEQKEYESSVLWDESLLDMIDTLQQDAIYKNSNFAPIDIKKHKHEFPEAYQMIVKVKKYLDSNINELRSFINGIKVESNCKHELKFADSDNDDYNVLPYELFGICFCNTSDRPAWYPTFELFNRIDSNIMEAGADINIKNVFIYEKDGKKTILSDYKNFVDNTNKAYNSIIEFNEYHKTHLIWQKLVSMKKVSYPSALSLFMKTDTLKQPKLLKRKAISTRQDAMLQ